MTETTVEPGQVWADSRDDFMVEVVELFSDREAVWVKEHEPDGRPRRWVFPLADFVRDYWLVGDA